LNNITHLINEAGGIGAEGGRSINGGKETEEAGSKGI